MAMVGTQPSSARSYAPIRPPQPQACELSLTTLNSKHCACTWATFWCVPKLPVAVEKKSPRQPGFPPCTSIFPPAARDNCHFKSCKKLAEVNTTPGFPLAGNRGTVACFSPPDVVSFKLCSDEKAATVVISNAHHCIDPPFPMEAIMQRFTLAENSDACLLKANLFLFQKV